MEAFKDYHDTFELSFKYSIAHMYSVPNPPFIKDALPLITSEHRTWLTVRDDDIYSFRWGNPEFAREFIRNMPGPDKVAGFYMGPDGFVWGRDFLGKDPETPRELVISKRWYSFMLWGRLSYEPDQPDSLFQKTIAQRAFRRFRPRNDGSAWSRSVESLSGYHPFLLGRYRCALVSRGLSEPSPRGSGLLYGEAFHRRRDHAGQRSAEHHRLAVEEITPARRTSRWKASRRCRSPTRWQDHGAKTLRLVSGGVRVAVLGKLQPEPGTQRLTLGDMEAMAHLGNYYAEKIRGAADLALFDKSGKPEMRESSIRHLQAALDHWKRYATSYTIQYEQPKLYNRVGWVDIPGLTKNVEQDIAIARLWAPGTEPDTLNKQRRADTPFPQVMASFSVSRRSAADRWFSLR